MVLIVLFVNYQNNLNNLRCIIWWPLSLWLCMCHAILSISSIFLTALKIIIRLIWRKWVIYLWVMMASIRLMMIWFIWKFRACRRGIRILIIIIGPIRWVKIWAVSWIIRRQGQTIRPGQILHRRQTQQGRRIRWVYRFRRISLWIGQISKWMCFIVVPVLKIKIWRNWIERPGIQLPRSWRRRRSQRKN